MKPPDLRTLVTRQTDQVTLLTLQLEASLTHNARLNARLSTALDTLDILQAELDAERRKNDKYLWMNLVQELQREKDEMKEVVEFLIRKVERSAGNFDRWPSAMMYLPCPAGRSTRSLQPTPPPVTPPRVEALLHALAVERGRCRQASEALQAAHETILTLEAQVARREAELESHHRQTVVEVKPIPQKRSIIEALHPDIPEVSPSEIIHSLNVAEEHNHVLERQISEFNDRRDEHNSRFTSVAIQTSPPQSEAPSSPHPSPPGTPKRTGHTRREGSDCLEDLRIEIQRLSNTIDDFGTERRTTERALKLRRIPTSPRSRLPASSSESDDGEISPIPRSPPEYQPPPEPSSPQPPSQATPPNFQNILRIEDECVRLTRINERLERELAELRTATSPVSRASSISFFRSPAHRSSALPAVSPGGFSARSTGERDMEISSTPLRSSTSLPENRLSDFEFFLGHTHPSSPTNSSVNPEPPGDDTINPNSPEAGASDSKGRPSSAPPDDTHLSVLLSPFQLSPSLPPRSKSAEPPSRHQEQIPET